MDYETLYKEKQEKEEQWCDLIHLIPSELWSIDNHVVDEFKTVKEYLETIKKNILL